MLFKGKSILITGGTGSLGGTLLRRLLSDDSDLPQRIVVLSRDEAKQSALKAAYGMDEVLGPRFRRIVQFSVGDVRDYSSVCSALDDVDTVFNAAALKQVPACEYFPFEAVCTNVAGPENIVRAIQQGKHPVETVVGISTDKACKPVNVMGMTKAIQERLLLNGNKRCPNTRFVCVRFGNVLASRGSVIPLFQEQIKKGGPVTVTVPEMTRFLMSLDSAVDTVFAAARTGLPGETYVPRMQSALVANVASIMIGGRPIEIKFVGIRPGEKIHEILVSEEEIFRTYARDNYYVITSVLEEFKGTPALVREFDSEDVVMDYPDTEDFLRANGVIND
jgi:FlaA1/EpsC-like NDP-sugar epimerase